MAAQKIDEAVLAALEERAGEQGLDIVSVEVSGPSSHPTLRVRVDLVEGGPIDMDRVTAVTPWVAGVVEALDPFSGAYELEVSSPGIDRPLRRPDDFVAFTGEKVEFDSLKPIEGRKSWTGILKGFENGCALVEVDGIVEELPLSNMKRCHIKPDYEKIFAAAKQVAKQLEEAQDSCDDEEEE